MGCLCPGDKVAPSYELRDEREVRAHHEELTGDLVNRAGEGSKRFKNMLEAFQYCDSKNTGNITDHARFAEVAAELTGVSGDIETVWGHLDQDGNGAVNFPEFVEWAELAKVDLEIGLPPGADDAQGGVAFPHQWTGARDAPEWNIRVPVTNTDELRELQELMNLSYKKAWTRDRKATGVNKVPTAYILDKAMRNENYSDWKRYYMKRHMMAHNCSTSRDFQQRPALTNGAKAFHSRSRLRDYCNEWALFHGTSHEAAETICGGDFTMKLAGSATGTLYGRGTYFAESITKADEYAKVGEENMCCALICRVVGGRVRYTDEVTPDADELQNSVTVRGEYDCVLGDREKCRGTYKEYVIFDADQVYVEYVIYYTRVYD